VRSHDPRHRPDKDPWVGDAARMWRSPASEGVAVARRLRRRAPAVPGKPGQWNGAIVHDQILTHLGAALVAGSLTNDALLAETEVQPVLPILPDANVVKIGGQSFIDRGRAAVFPLLDELLANLARHKLIVGTGAGTRARHAYSVGLDLGMPTGVLSILGTFVSMQNARMLHYLLAKHGIPFIAPAQFAQLPFYLEERRAVIFFGMPPYIYWQPNPAIGRIPPNRTDTGAYLVSEVFGARSMIYVKDEDGLYTADPKKDRNAKFIPRVTVEELDALDLADVVVERSVLEFMKNAEHRRSIQIINGLVPGNLTRALDGEPVGTIITA
jgi:molybdenum storage protein